MRIIITDLTRFANRNIVCMAGINPDTYECIRPLPYIQKSSCQKLNILPGAVIDGNFTPYPCTAPHYEDKNAANMKFLGPCSSEEFKRLLKNTSHVSVENGFEVTLTSGQKHIPHDKPPCKSIITLSLIPSKLDIVEDSYKQGQLRVNFIDQAGKNFHYLSITDLGFFEYAKRHAEENRINELNDFIHSQKDLFIRLGLGRVYKANDGRNGFWLQVNGLYTFPEYNKEIRCYS